MATLHGLLKKHPEWWRHLAVAIGEYGDIAANAPSDLMIPENERRVVAVLLRQCDCRFPPPYGGRPQEAPLTQAELAAMSNVSRSTLGTILRSLQDAGLISIGYGNRTHASRAPIADAVSHSSIRCSHSATLTHQVPA